MSFAACVKNIPKPIVSDKPAEFFLIDQYIDSKGIFKDEDYVIANLPKKISVDEILALVEDYNRKTITVDMIKTYFISRDFYRETEDLTKAYQRGAPYPRPGAEYRYFGDDPGQQIRYHSDDFLIRTSYSRASDGISIRLSWYFDGAKESKESLERRIPDINSYFTNSGESILNIPPHPSLDDYKPAMSNHQQSGIKTNALPNP